MTKENRKKAAERMRKRWSIPGEWEKVFRNRSTNPTWKASRNRCAKHAAKVLHNEHKNIFLHGRKKVAKALALKHQTDLEFHQRHMRLSLHSAKSHINSAVAHRTKDFRKAQSKVMTKRWKDLRYLMKFKQSMRKHWDNPEWCNKIQLQQKEVSNRLEQKALRKKLGKENSKRLREDYASGKRQPVGQGFVKSGWIKTKKNGKIYYRGSWELFFIKLLESARIVKSFVPQPFGIPYKFKSEWHTYFPDFLVTLKDGEKWLVEIKGQKFPTYKAKCKAAFEYCKENGLNWTIINECPIKPLTEYLQ